MKNAQITATEILTAENFEIEVAAAVLNKYGSWDFESEYEDFKQGTLFGGCAGWETFEGWLSNTRVRIMARDGETTYEMKWYDGHSWINALGSDATGDDAETAKNIEQLVSDGCWHEVITWDK
jgi:hypothetical protein